MDFQEFHGLILSAIEIAREADEYYSEYGRGNAVKEYCAKSIIEYLEKQLGDTGEKYTPTHTSFVHYYIYEILLNGASKTITNDEGLFITLDNALDLYTAILDFA